MAIGDQDTNTLVVDELEVGKALVADRSRLLCTVGDVKGVCCGYRVVGDCHGLYHTAEGSVQLETICTSVTDEVWPHSEAVGGQGGTEAT